MSFTTIDALRTAIDNAENAIIKGIEDGNLIDLMAAMRPDIVSGICFFPISLLK